MRLLCEKIELEEIEDELVQRVRGHAGGDWATDLDGIADLRKRLLQLQRYQCAYCQGTIPSDSNGLRELDHVLPKKPSPWAASPKRKSAVFEDRYHTDGYPEFCFEPINIVITCKQCNTFKGTFDTLLDRAAVVARYPADGGSFLWVHPYFHTYSDHVRITDEWLYQSLSDEGAALIKICKLDEAEVIARRRAAEAYVSQSRDLSSVLFKFSAHYDRLTRQESRSAISARFGISIEDADTLVSMSFEAGQNRDPELLARACSLAHSVESAAARKKGLG
jgi:hypothetical protein